MNKLKYRKIVKKPYYYVPPCPHCRSRMTGRYVRAHRATETDWMITESLKNGELIEPVPEIVDETCFCSYCGHSWKGYIETRMLTLEEISEEKRARKTNDILKVRLDEEREALMERRSKYKTLPGKIFNGVIETITGFIGKI